jgi:hypothetical protein
MITTVAMEPLFTFPKERLLNLACHVLPDIDVPLCSHLLVLPRGGPPTLHPNLRHNATIPTAPGQTCWRSAINMLRHKVLHVIGNPLESDADVATQEMVFEPTTPDQVQSVDASFKSVSRNRILLGDRGVVGDLGDWESRPEVELLVNSWSFWLIWISPCCDSLNTG